jgi:hypothetical protein
MRMFIAATNMMFCALLHRGNRAWGRHHRAGDGRLPADLARIVRRSLSQADCESADYASNIEPRTFPQGYGLRGVHDGNA